MKKCVKFWKFSILFLLYFVWNIGNYQFSDRLKIIYDSCSDDGLKGPVVNCACKSLSMEGHLKFTKYIFWYILSCSSWTITRPLGKLWLMDGLQGTLLDLAYPDTLLSLEFMCPTGTIYSWGTWSAWGIWGTWSPRSEPWVMMLGRIADY